MRRVMISVQGRMQARPQARPHARAIRAARSRRGPSSRLLVIALTSACLLLAACAGPSATGQATPTPTAPVTPTANAGSAEHCPLAREPAGVVPADVVVRDPEQNGRQISLRTGQTLEIHTPAMYQWAFSENGSARVVTPRQPNGWYAGDGTCAWQFAAGMPGQVTLAFEGRPVCIRGQVCPQFVLPLRFTVNVSR